MRTVENIDGVRWSFENDADFIAFVQSIFEENEQHTEPEDILEMPTTAKSCERYIDLKCGNLELFNF